MRTSRIGPRRRNNRYCGAQHEPRRSAGQAGSVRNTAGPTHRGHNQHVDMAGDFGGLTICSRGFADSAVGGDGHRCGAGNMPLAAIVFSATASAVDTNAGLTVSIAAAPRRWALPRQRPASRACSARCLSWREVGHDVELHRRAACPGVGSARRRSTHASRRRFAGRTAHNRGEEIFVARLPLISAPTVPSRASLAAWTAATRGWSSVSTMGRLDKSIPALLAVSRIRVSGPTSSGAR